MCLCVCSNVRVCVWLSWEKSMKVCWRRRVEVVPIVFDLSCQIASAFIWLSVEEVRYVNGCVCVFVCVGKNVSVYIGKWMRRRLLYYICVWCVFIKLNLSSSFTAQCKSVFLDSKFVVA